MLCRAWSIGILQRNQQSYGEGKYLGVKETWEAFGITSKTHKKMEKRLKFQLDRVRIFLYEQKSIQTIRERIYGKNWEAEM